uniref:Uncharacterized protein n=1 Tax=Anguilla anguilla TaxID=7936 RepID=A0A0E9RA46_ANGAN
MLQPRYFKQKSKSKCQILIRPTGLLVDASLHLISDNGRYTPS